MIKILIEAAVKKYGSLYKLDQLQGFKPRDNRTKKFFQGLQKTIDIKNKKLNLIGYELVLKRKAGNND